MPAAKRIPVTTRRQVPPGALAILRQADQQAQAATRTAQTLFAAVASAMGIPESPDVQFDAATGLITYTTEIDAPDKTEPDIEPASEPSTQPAVNLM